MMKEKKWNYIGSVGKHAVLISFSILALFPILVIVINSFKERTAIFSNPYSIPNSDTFSLIGYETVLERSNFTLYYKNSLIIMLGALFLILFFGTMAAYAIAEYKVKISNFLFVYFLIGIIVPIRLGSVGILEIMVNLHLTNTLTGLILIYTVAGLPLAIFILTQFFRQIPVSLKEAARIDGASEWKIYLMTLNYIKPAIASVAAFSVAPIWNDIWWPLIIAPAEEVCTVTMGAQKFLGQFSNDWNALLSALSMAMVPLVLLYLIFSKHIMRGLVDGAVKG
ncbi:carbohydrate ABC transporter permease [Lachnospiraceae bacterium KGMB03038]|nr:carbohydrate ABC transporter permease [Lachnospiraceae bacterium KGMB03038]